MSLLEKKMDEIINKNYGNSKKENKKEEKEIIETSFYIDDKYILEQVYNDKNEFCVYNRETKEITYAEKYEKENQIIIPIMGEEIIQEVVRLPTKAEPYNTIEELDKEIYDFIKEWLDVDELYNKISVWNIRFSWVYDKFHTLNYLRALGDTGTGKSRFLDTLGLISYKPMMVSGALTPAPIFRLINKWKGTLLIDEGDQKTSDEADSFIKILNCGYEKGRSVMRCDQNDANKLNFFVVYCPKVITTRQRFTDKATEARCLTKIMTQTGRKDIKDVLTNDFFEKSLNIRNKLLYYRLTNYDLIDPEAGMKVDLNKYEPRLRQVNRGFVSLFMHDPKSLNYFYEQLDSYQISLREERSESFEGCLVNSVAQLMRLGNQNISPSMIAEYYNENIGGKYEAHSRTLSKKINALGLKFHRKKINGKTMNVLDFSNRDVLLEVFSRYVVDVDLINNLKVLGYDVTLVTSVTSPPPENENDEMKKFVDPRNCRNYRNDVTLNNEKFVINLFEKEEKIIFEEHLEKVCTANNRMSKTQFIDILMKLKGEGFIFEPKNGEWKKI